MLIGRLLLFVLAFLVIAGLTHDIAAAGNTSSCSSIMASTPLCDELLTQTCIQNAKEEIPQIQSSIIITSPKETTTPQTTFTQPETFSLDSDKIFDLVNQYRASLGLASFEREESVCQLAQVRSTELAWELANGSIHSGLYNRNLTFWIWENAKVGSNEEGTVAWWLASPIHRESIVGDYKFSCVKCTGSQCSQLFTNFDPK